MIKKKYCLNIIITARTFLIFFMCTFLQVVSAQKNYITIKGRVVTADGTPAFVTVYLKNTKAVTGTDESGIFTLTTLTASNDSLIITSVGLQQIMIAIKPEMNKEINVGVIHLNTNIAQLQDVEVTGRINQSYKNDYSFFANKTETPARLIPQTISVITKELIQDKMEFTLKDAVGDAAGINQYSGYDEYTIRGFRAENAHNINGLRGYNSTYTSNMLVNVERIEIIKGPVATLYGNCDPGGTINLVTKKPLSINKTEFSVYGGSWNHFRAEGDNTGALNKRKNLLYRFNAGYDDTKSFRDQFFSKSFQAAPSFTFITNDKLKINVDFSFSHINTILDRGQPGFSDDETLHSTPIQLSLTQPGDHLNETDFATILSASYKVSREINFNTGFLNYITRQNVAEHSFNKYITNESVYLSFDTWKYNTATNSTSNYFTWQHQFGKLNNRLLVGYDYIRSGVNLNQQYFELPQYGKDSGIVGVFSLRKPQYVKRQVGSYAFSNFNNSASDVDGEIYSTQGIYVQDEISFSKWRFLLGLRQEFYKSGDDDDDVSAGDDDDASEENVLLPRISMLYSLKPTVSIYATYNTGFDPFEASTATQIFNDPFKPVKSRLIEAGIKTGLFKNELSATVSVYRLTVTNVAVNANNISNPYLYVQQGENRSTGLETELAGDVLSNLSISVNYSYCLAKVTKSKVPEQVGTIAENAPKNTSSSWIKYTFSNGSLKGFGLSAGHSQVGERNTLQHDFLLPAFIIINAGIHYTCKHIGVAFNLDNITNKTYWTAAYNNIYKWPGAPRNFMFSVDYKL